MFVYKKLTGVAVRNISTNFLENTSYGVLNKFKGLQPATLLQKDSVADIFL